MNNEQPMMFSEIDTGRVAIFSPDRKYRYYLEQIWNKDKPLVGFLMLNPSTADEFKNDPTVQRCVNFVKDWGYGGLAVCNIFAYRSTDPSELYNLEDPIGPENDAYIDAMFNKVEFVIGAWGAHGKHLGRGDSIMDKYRDSLYALSMTKNKQPGHPLYLKSDLLPQPMTPEWKS